MLATFLALTIAAPALKDKPGPDSLLVGEWLAEAVTIGGDFATEPGHGKLIHVFTKDGAWIIRSGARPTRNRPCGFVTDLGKKPFEINLRYEFEDPSDVCILGIFRVEGDTLTMCYAPAEDGRPTAFESPARSRTVLWKFKRIRKD
jgi:uncharacterized protein (TIGR03067 family)